jgi:Fe(3+) dicitrate transport protein
MNRNKSYKFALLSVIIGQIISNSSFANSLKDEEKKDYKTTIMERVMVVGSDNKNIAGSAHFINKEILNNYSYKDVNRILKQVPGVNIQEEDGFGLRPNIGLRGGRSDRSADVTLMEDGILIAPAPYSAPSAYYFPRVGRMESVEVRKGSSTIEFGPRTTSGAVNLISNAVPDKKSFGATAAYGSFNTNILNARYGDKVNNFSYLIDLSHEKSKGFKKIDVVDKDTGYSIQDVMTKIKYDSDEDSDIYQSIELKLGYTKEDSNETYLGLEESDFRNNPYRRYAATQLDNMDSNHQQYQLRHFIDFNDFDLTTTIYRNDFARNWYKLETKNVTSSLDQNNLTIRANNRDYYSQGIQSIIAKKFDTKPLEHNLKLSARYHIDAENRFQRNDSYNLVNGVMNLNSKGVNGLAGNQQLKSSAIALFVNDNIKYNKFTLTPGLRYENIDLKKTDYNSSAKNNKNNVEVIIPALGSTYQINDSITTFASIHKGFAPPTPGSDNKKEEKSTNYELGLRYNNKSLKSSIVGFFNKYDNLLGECTASSGNGSCEIGDQFNGGRVDVKGLELELSYNFLESYNSKYQLPLTFNYSYTDARFKNNFTSDFSEWGSVEKGYQLPYIAKNQFYINFGLITPKWKFNINGKYMGKMRSKAGSGSIAENQLINRNFIVDLASEVEIYKNTRLFFNIDNLFDKTYIASRSPDRARPGKPFSFLTGAKYSF